MLYWGEASRHTPIVTVRPHQWQPDCLISEMPHLNPPS